MPRPKLDTDDGRAETVEPAPAPLAALRGVRRVAVAVVLCGLIGSHITVGRSSELLPTAVWVYLACAWLVALSAGGTPFARRRAHPGPAAIWVERWGARRVGLLVVAAGGVLVAYRVGGPPMSRLEVAAELAVWTTSIVAFLAAFAAPSGRRARRRALRPPWRVGLALFAFAAALRLVALDRLPLTFGGDEGTMAMQAQAVLHGELADPFSTAWMGHPTLFYFVQALPLRLFGFEVFATRVMPALFGAATVPVAFALGRALLGGTAGLVAAVLTATSFWHLAYSRMGLNNIIDPFFLLLAVLALWHALYGPDLGCRALAGAAAGVAAGLSQYGYTSARLIPFLLLALIVHACVVSGSPATWPRWLWGRRLIVSACAAGFIVAALPLLTHFVTVPGSYMARVNQASIFHSGWLDQVVAARGTTASAVLAEQFGRTAQAFTRYTSAIAFYDPGRPLLMDAAQPFFVAGIVAATAFLRRPAAGFLAAMFYAPLIAGGVLSETTPNSARLILLAPVVPLIVAAGLAAVRAALERVIRARVAGPALVALVVAATTGADLYFFFVQLPARRGDANSAIASDLGRYIHALGADAPRYRAYLFGSPYLFYEGFNSIAFLGNRLPGQDVDADALDPAGYVDGSTGAIFALPIQRAAQLARLRDEFPAAKTAVFAGPGPRGEPVPLLTILRVEPDEIAAWSSRRPPATAPPSAGAGR